LLSACSSAAPVQPHAPEAAAQRTVDLPGKGNGVFWDDKEHALYVTDDTHGQIVRWTDAHGFESVGTFATTDKLELGGVVRVDDATFATTLFGGGKAGGVLVLAHGTSSSVSGLDPVRRRIGIARAPDGALYDAYYVVDADKKHTGGVARLDLAGRE